MKVLFKTFYLFILGILADSYKAAFDREIDRRIARGGDISSKRLTRMSDRSYRLYMNFREVEKSVKYDLKMTVS